MSMTERASERELCMYLADGVLKSTRSSRMRPGTSLVGHGTSYLTQERVVRKRYT